jgi:phosphoglycolate phosphatase-like HAD superfamily hydrolase
VSNSYHAPTFDILSCDCVIWDFDGTLFDLGIDWGGLRSRLHGLLQSVPGYVGPEPRSIEGFVSEARRLGRAQMIFDAIAEAECEGLAQWDRGLKPIPTELFLHLKSKSVVVSNNVSGTLQSFLERIGAPEVSFVSRDMVNQPKPDAEGALQLRSRWEGKKTVLIGDSEIDRELAKACDVLFIHVQSVIDSYPHGVRSLISRGQS